MKAARHLSVAILLVVCLAALYGSYYLISDPTGRSLGLPMHLLNGTIFENYNIIGWILLYTVGLFSLLVLCCISFRVNFYPFLIILQGVKLCIYIFIQVLLLGHMFLIQVAFLLAGVALIVLGAFQNQKKMANNERV